MVAAPAPSRWLPFTVTILTVILVAVAYWGYCASRAAKTTELAEETWRLYQAEAVTLLDVVVASQAALEADRAVPLRGERAALAAHMRRMGKLRMRAEMSFPSSNQTRPIVESTIQYELARRQLANAAGEAAADTIDMEFDFPFRDQFNGHPAAETGK